LPSALAAAADWSSLEAEPVSFEDLFAIPGEARAALLPHVPKFDHALYDLSRRWPAEEEDDERLKVVLELQRLARAGGLAE
jgi:hypothetical protein